jgi:hypothetical protein
MLGVQRLIVTAKGHHLRDILTFGGIFLDDECADERKHANQS